MTCIQPLLLAKFAAFLQSNETSTKWNSSSTTDGTTSKQNGYVLAAFSLRSVKFVTWPLFQFYSLSPISMPAIDSGTEEYFPEVYRLTFFLRGDTVILQAWENCPSDLIFLFCESGPWIFIFPATFPPCPRNVCIFQHFCASIYPNYTLCIWFIMIILYVRDDCYINLCKNE